MEENKKHKILIDVDLASGEGYGVTLVKYNDKTIASVKFGHVLLWEKDFLFEESQENNKTTIKFFKLQDYPDVNDVYKIS